MKNWRLRSTMQHARSLSAGLLAAVAMLLVGRNGYGRDIAAVEPTRDPSLDRRGVVPGELVGYVDLGELGEQWGQSNWGGGPPQPRPE